MSVITTYTGKHIDPAEPRPDGIDIRDIAHALSLTCRGNGHVRTFYSVGQHCISCAREALARGYDRETALMCLLHDASEAYMSDVPRPFKKYLTVYLELEERLLEMIYRHFLGHVPDEQMRSRLKEIDDDMLWYDLTLLLNEPQKDPAPVMFCEHDRTVVPFEIIEAEYLSLYEALTAEV